MKKVSLENVAANASSVNLEHLGLENRKKGL